MLFRSENFGFTSTIITISPITYTSLYCDIKFAGKVLKVPITAGRQAAILNPVYDAPLFDWKKYIPVVYQWGKNSSNPPPPPKSNDPPVTKSIALHCIVVL